MRAAARPRRSACSISAPATAARSRSCSRRVPRRDRRRPRLRRRDAPPRPRALRRATPASRSGTTTSTHRCRPRSAGSTSSCRASRSITSRPPASARSTARSSPCCAPGGVFVNAEHVASATDGCTWSSSPRSGAPPTTTTRRTNSLPSEQHLTWLDDVGFVEQRLLLEVAGARGRFGHQAGGGMSRRSVGTIPGTEFLNHHNRDRTTSGGGLR